MIHHTSLPSIHPGALFRRLMVMPSLKTTALGALLSLTGASPSMLADQFQLHYESAPAVTGPWTKPVQDGFITLPDGTIQVPNTGSNQLFRLSIQRMTGGTNSPYETLDSLPQRTLDLARQHFLQFAGVQNGDGSTPDDNSNWNGTEKISPRVLKFYDPTYEGGSIPAYYEFKIVAADYGTNAPTAFLAGTMREPETDRGYLLVCAHESDTPVAEFSTGGKTPGEQLLGSLSSQEGTRLFRFGPAFKTVEDAGGNLLGSLGTQPFKVPADILRYGNPNYAGTFNSETDADPEKGSAGPKFVVEHYSSYQDFKGDFVKNPVYQEMRSRRALACRTEWDLINGRRVTPPQMLMVGVLQVTNILNDRFVTRFLLDDENVEAPLAAIVTNKAGGLTIAGMRPGGALLTVQSSLGVSKYWLTVPDAAGTAGAAQAVGNPQSFVGGWQKPVDWWCGAPFGDQPIYYQPLRPQWCKAVGCGPLAWAMLLAWWDHKGVPSAFAANLPNRYSSAKSVDSQMIMKEGQPGWQALFSLLDELHDDCDVICSPTSNAGATWPSDMAEAILGKTYTERKVYLTLGMSYYYSWDLIDPDWNNPSTLARQSIWNGRPSALGLGFLWHYALAYGYRYHEYKTSENSPPLLVKRWFACNEGWNKANGVFYSGNDTFFGTHIRFWQKP